MNFSDPEIKEAISFYAIWSTFIGILMMIVRPFYSVFQLIRELVITFVISFLCGLGLEYFDMPIPVKCAISGTSAVFAIFIYNIIAKILNQVEKDPLKAIKNIKDK